jgi:hypothetical protein
MSRPDRGDDIQERIKGIYAEQDIRTGWREEKGLALWKK